LYQEIYRLGTKLAKRDRFGIHFQLESLILNSLALTIDASLQKQKQKITPLQELRRKIAVIKHLVRSECELKIIEEKIYLDLQRQLQEISKMASGWEKYVTEKEP